MNLQAMPNHNEQAIISDNGNRNGYTVNFELMNTKAYHDRFENLTKRKAVNESLYKNAARILSHRSGTEYEDLVIIDARTGELLTENLSAAGMRTFQCCLSQEQTDLLTARGKKFVALHNHPNNSFPSPSDVSALFSRELESGSVVACHDGVVYYLEKIRNLSLEEVKELISSLRKKISGEFCGLPENLVEKRVAMSVIERLEAVKAVRFKKVL